MRRRAYAPSDAVADPVIISVAGGADSGISASEASRQAGCTVVDIVEEPGYALALASNQLIVSPGIT